MALSTAFADSTVSATNHAQAHNDTNTAVNQIAGFYWPFAHGGATVGAGVTAATYIVWGGGAALATSAAGALAAVNTAAAAFRLDPAFWTMTGFVPKVRIHWMCHVGATAPAQTLTCGLYPVTTFTNTGVAVVGTVVSGTTAAFASPAANSHTLTTTTDVNVPSANWYVLGVAVGGTTATSSSVQLVAQVQVRVV